MVDDEDGRAFVRFRGRPSGRRAGDGLGRTYREHFPRRLGYRPAAPNAPPSPDRPSTDPSGDATTVFTFTAQVSDDHDQPSAIQVRWDWNGDGTWDTSWSTTKTATHTFSSAGDYTVVVRAIDSG